MGFCIFCRTGVPFGNGIMCGSSRPARTKETGTRHRLAVAVAIAFVFAVAAMSSSAQAQIALIPPRAPPPRPSPTVVNFDVSAGAAVANLGSNFLERLGNQATYGFGSALRDNPAGGGAQKLPTHRVSGPGGRPTESRPGLARWGFSLAIVVRPGVVSPGWVRASRPAASSSAP